MDQEPDEETAILIEQLAIYFLAAQLIFIIVGVGLIIPHLFITTRKSMRTSSTNSLIIGIAFCDLFVLIGTFSPLNWNASENCYNDRSYFRISKLIITNMLLDTFTRSSYYLGLSLAVIRLLVISFPMNLRIGTLSKQSIGFYVLAGMIFVKFLPSANYSLRYDVVPGEDWIPPETCTSFLSNYSEKQYSDVLPSEFQYDLYQIISGVLQCFVSIAHPIFAILLYLEIRRSSKSAVRVSSQKTSDRKRTSKMVLLMTISYVLSSAPMGLNFFLMIYVRSSFVLNIVVGYGGIIISIFFTINASMHCIICLVMSSEYQKTVKGLLRIGRDKRVVVVQSVTVGK